MIHYRHFTNSDPPLLAEVWRSCAGHRGLAQPITAGMFELYVLSKPYFDPEGLILALDGERRPVGFVHAGFGPNEDESGLATELGVTVLLLTVSHPEEPATAERLLELAEEYLQRRGARVLYGGAVRPLNPFYLGLYGGSELPGVLDSDPAMQDLFRAHAYREIDRTLIMHRELSSFRPVVDRQQMQIRRSAEVERLIDPPPRSWWDSATLGPYERTLFRLRPRTGGPPMAAATFWNMEPFNAAWGVRASGLIEIDVAATERHKGLATFLLGEAMRQLGDENVAVIEAQTMQGNAPSVAMYRKLGFQQVDSGAVFRKEPGSSMTNVE